jgi:hypothetical protein
MANGLLSPVERQTKEVFGMVPMKERLALLPRYSKDQGLIAPQFIYELAKAVSTPVTAAKGYDVSPEEAINVGMAGMGGGAFGSAPKGSLRTFIGRNAKTWDKAAETKFLELEKKGVSPEEMWKQTGTFRSPDKQLRQEISDVNLKIKDYRATGGGISISHPELQAAYDQIPRGVRVQHTPELDQTAGYKSPRDALSWKMGEGGTIFVNADQIPPKDVYAHELQHAIQAKEGFARGGSPEKIKKDFMQFAPSEWVEYAKSLPNYQNQKTPEAQKAFIESFVKMRLGSPDEAYLKLAGEAEARAVQARMNMTPAQRSQTFPLQSYDVPIDQLIIKGLID